MPPSSNSFKSSSSRDWGNYGQELIHYPLKLCHSRNKITQGCHPLSHSMTLWKNCRGADKQSSIRNSWDQGTTTDLPTVLIQTSLACTDWPFAPAFSHPPCFPTQCLHLSFTWSTWSFTCSLFSPALFFFYLFLFHFYSTLLIPTS